MAGKAPVRDSNRAVYFTVDPSTYSVHVIVGQRKQAVSQQNQTERSFQRGTVEKVLKETAKKAGDEQERTLVNKHAVTIKVLAIPKVFPISKPCGMAQKVPLLTPISKEDHVKVVLFPKEEVNREVPLTISHSFI